MEISWEASKGFKDSICLMPNITSKIQALDLEIIANSKLLYYRFVHDKMEETDKQEVKEVTETMSNSEKEKDCLCLPLAISASPPGLPMLQLVYLQTLQWPLLPCRKIITFTRQLISSQKSGEILQTQLLSILHCHSCHNSSLPRQRDSSQQSY